MNRKIIAMCWKVPEGDSHPSSQNFTIGKTSLSVCPFTLPIHSHGVQTSNYNFEKNNAWKYIVNNYRADTYEINYLKDI